LTSIAREGGRCFTSESISPDLFSFREKSCSNENSSCQAIRQHHRSREKSQAYPAKRGREQVNRGFLPFAIAKEGLVLCVAEAPVDLSHTLVTVGAAELLNHSHEEEHPG